MLLRLSHESDRVREAESFPCPQEVWCVHRVTSVSAISETSSVEPVTSRSATPNDKHMDHIAITSKASSNFFCADNANKQRIMVQSSSHSHMYRSHTAKSDAVAI